MSLCGTLLETLCRCSFSLPALPSSESSSTGLGPRIQSVRLDMDNVYCEFSCELSDVCIHCYGKPKKGKVRHTRHKPVGQCEGVSTNNTVTIRVKEGNVHHLWDKNRSGRVTLKGQRPGGVGNTSPVFTCQVMHQIFDQMSNYSVSGH